MRRPQPKHRWPALIGLILLATVGGVAQGQTEQDELVDQLGHPIYETRLDAQRRLTAEGLSAFDALRRGLDHADPEVVEACWRLIQGLTPDWSRDVDPPVVHRWLVDHQRLPISERVPRIEWFHRRVRGQSAVEVLVRIARFDPSDAPSAEAATRLLETVPMRAQPYRRHRLEFDRVRLDAIRVALGRLADLYGPSDRPAICWLELSVEPDSPEEALRVWRRDALGEGVVAVRPRDLSPTARETLLWCWLRAALRAGDADEAVAATASLVELDDTFADQRVGQAVRWAARAGDWGAGERLLERFADRLDDKRGAYVRAEFAKLSGDAETADRLAAEAREAEGTPSEASIEEVKYGVRIVVADELADHGLLDWAIAEYDAASEPLEPFDGAVAVARWRSANLLFDAGRFEEAAARLTPVVAAARGPKLDYTRLPQVEERDAPTLDTLRARERYFAALAARAQGDSEAEVAALRKAIAADPGDADILIAMHDVKSPPDGFAAETRRRINRLCREFESDIWKHAGDSNPVDESNPLNQWAWLVSNTFGDFGKAVRYSRRSLELLPETAGYLDTLGRCLFSAGSVEEAIATQRRAIELEPNSLVMKRQLAEFEAALVGSDSEEESP